MFISTIASSSRLPRSALSSPCHLCRLLSTSAPRSVKRPQKPYEAPIAKIDVYGNRIPLPSEMDKGSIKTREFLETLAERRAKTPTEKYGSSHGFGIKQRQRRSSSSVDRDADREGTGIDENHQSAEKDEYEERRDELWREKIGLQQSCHGKGKFVSAEQQFREEAARLNQAGSSKDGSARSYDRADRGTRDRFSGRGMGNDFSFSKRDGPRSDARGDSRFGSSSFGSGSSFDSNSNRSTPRKTFGLNREARSPSSTTSERPYTPRNRFDSDSNPNSNGIRFRDQSPKTFGPHGQSQFAGQHKTPSTIIFSDEKKVKKSYGISDTRQFEREGREGGYRDHNHAGSSNTPTHHSTTTTPPSHTSESQSEPAPGPKSASRPWQPTKKLTYSAMAGLKALHQVDPEKFTRAVLSKKFGISHEAVSRILKSKYRDADLKVEEGVHTLKGTTLKGTKWDRNPSTSESISPVPAIMRAYERINNRE
ncbi:hypothetical protein IAT40_001395 [Kwoniella sp. CBS 6097]